MTTLPKWFWVAAVLALLWNLLGCLAFTADLRLSPADIGRLPAAQQILYAARPGWAVAATAVAVAGGALGCIGLLLRRKWALAVFLLSLAGVLLQDYGLFIFVDGAALAGPFAIVLQSIVLLVAIWLVLLSRHAIGRGWLV